jgi:hypothetical protein
VETTLKMKVCKKDYCTTTRCDATVLHEYYQGTGCGNNIENEGL